MAFVTPITSVPAGITRAPKASTVRLILTLARPASEPKFRVAVPPVITPASRLTLSAVPPGIVILCAPVRGVPARSVTRKILPLSTCMIVLLAARFIVPASNCVTAPVLASIVKVPLNVAPCIAL